jgi:hypothetical protein
MQRSEYLADVEGALDVGTPFTSVYTAVQNFMLAARGRGIGTTLTTVFRIYQDEVRTICEIPSRFEIIALILMGRPRGTFRRGRRRPAEQLTHWNRFGNKRNEAVGAWFTPTALASSTNDVELDPPILGATFFGLVGGDRTRLAEALRHQLAAADAEAHQVVLDRLGTMLGESLVVLIGASGVGVTIHGHSDPGIFAQDARGFCQCVGRVGTDRGLVEIEVHAA